MNQKAEDQGDIRNHIRVPIYNMDEKVMAVFLIQILRRVMIKMRLHLYKIGWNLVYYVATNMEDYETVNIKTVQNPQGGVNSLN